MATTRKRAPENTAVPQPKEAPAPAPPTNPPWIWLARAAIVAAVLAAYFNSLGGAFVYDDIESIRDNAGIEKLWPLSEAMSLGMIDSGETVARRPLLSLSLAINHKFFGAEPVGYHVVNLLIHLAAGLLLFEIIRICLSLPRLAERYGDKAAAIAFAVALLWVVHPLQTESVTYIVQRAESLMGMLYLLTIYCSLRGFASEQSGRWYTVAMLACAAGMLVKEVMVSAPLMVFLFDGLLVSGSFLAALRARAKFYLALVMTWGLLFAVLYAGRDGVASDFTDRSPLAYALTQPGVILYYLRLSLWPQPLVMDYAWPTASTVPAIVPAACVIGIMLAATIWGIFRRQPWAFIGAWFFLILAPSSSFAALSQNLEEHRMYLSLAAVIGLLVLLAEFVLGKVMVGDLTRGRRLVAALLLLVVGVQLTLRTVARNFEYHDSSMLWGQNVEHRPDSAVAQNNYGRVLAIQAGAMPDARQRQRVYEQSLIHLTRAIEIRPNYAKAYYNLANTLADLGRVEEAVPYFRKAIELHPEWAQFRYQLGRALLELRRIDEALIELNEAIGLKPDFEQAHDTLGRAYLAQERFKDAADQFRRALRISPESADFHYNLAVAEAEQGKRDAESKPTLRASARSHLHEALLSDRGYFEAAFYLGAMAEEDGNLDEAAERYERAIQIRGDFTVAHLALGSVLAKIASASDDPQEADDYYGWSIERYQDVLSRNPDHWPAHLQLAKVLMQRGDRRTALEHLEFARQLQPDSKEIQDALLEAQQMGQPKNDDATTPAPSDTNNGGKSK